MSPILFFLCSLQFPEFLTHTLTLKMNSFSFFHYSENETIRVPSLRDDFEADLASDLAFKLQPRRMKQETMAIARLKGKLHVDHGKHFLVSEKNLIDSSESQLLLQWGRLDPNLLLLALHEKGIDGSVDDNRNASGEHGACFVCICQPKNALIEITVTRTVISSSDKAFASTIFEVISGMLDGI